MLDGSLVSSMLTQIKIWDINSGRELKSLFGHSDAVVTLMVHSDGSLISGSNDNTIRVWNTTNGKLKRTLKGHSFYVTSLAELRDGSLVSGWPSN